jgi:hypothetical protein
VVVYCIGTLLSILFIEFASRVKHKSEDSRYWFFVSLFAASPLIIIAAIRYDVGKDYLSYIRLFRQAAVGYRQDGLEIPFYWLNRIISFLGGDYIWIFIISAVLFMVISYMHIFEESPYPKLSVFLLVTMGFYFSFLNTMRQFVGCAFLLYSIKFIKDRKLIPFLSFVLLASCFHYTCIIFVIAYPLYGIRIKSRTLVISSIIVFLLASLLARYINQIAMLTYYGTAYIGSVFDRPEERGFITLAINILLIVFGTIFKSDDDDYNFYYILSFISLWFLFFEGKVPLISRIRWMFALPSIILLPKIINNVPNRRDRFIYTSLIVGLYIAFFYYTIGINNSNSVLPYQTIFSR